MKATTAQRSDYMKLSKIPYPNAATRRQLFHKFLDFLLMTASGIGIGAMLLFILANQ